MILTVEKNHRRHRLTYLIRMMLAMILAGFVLAMGFDSLIVPAGIYLAVSVAWIYIVERRYGLVKDRPWVKLVRDGVDFLFITVLLYLTGSLYSFMMLAYLGWTVGSSMSERRYHGLFTAIAGCVSVATLFALHRFAGLPVVTVFSGATLPFSSAQAVATLIALFLCVMVIHKYIFTIYRKLLEERETTSERNRTIEQDLENAKKFQQRIMPARSPSERISALCRPMELLGGDFYDFIQFREPDRIGVFLCDVSGHGTGAAFITAMIKMLLLQAGQEKMDPAAFLGYLNEMLSHEIDDAFVTAIYCIFDEGAGTMTYASAGHYHPIVIGPSGVARLSGKSSVPLGILKKADLDRMGKSFVNLVVVPGAGSRVLLYTDGLIEASASGGGESVYFDERLDDALMGLRALGCADVIAGLYRSLTVFHGGDEFDDDICLVCIEVC